MAELSPSEPQSLVGQVLARTYQLDRLLFAGGMGAVYAGRHLRTGGLLAAKVLHKGAVNNPEIFERFQDEARIIAALRHPNVVQVTDLGIDRETLRGSSGPIELAVGDGEPVRGIPYLIMELLEGEDLQELLERQGRLPLDDALRIAMQIGSALYTAHAQGVVHRDLKPHNIFLLRKDPDDPAPGLVKILDFGLSKIRRPASRATRDQMVLGTPKYLAPEAAQGQNSQIDGRSDQFSMAVILYRALSGRAAFDAPEMAEILRQVVYDQPVPLSRLAPELPGHVVAAIERALSKRKDDRFPNMREFVLALLGQSGAGWASAARSLSGILGPTQLMLSMGGPAEAQRSVSSMSSGAQPAVSSGAQRSVSSLSSGSQPALSSGAQRSVSSSSAMSSGAQPASGVQPASVGPKSVGALPALQMGAPADLLAPASGTSFSARRVLLGALCGVLLTCPILFVRGRAPAGRGETAAMQALQQARAELDAGRFAAASQRAGQVLADGRAPAELRELARSRKQQADGELAAAQAYGRFSSAAAGRRLEEALAAFEALPVGSSYRQRAAAARGELVALYAEQRLQRAEQHRGDALCLASRRELQGVLRMQPLHAGARAALFRDCGEGGAVAALPARAPRQVVLAALAYPPLRVADEEGGEAQVGAPDSLLAEARGAWVRGDQRRAIELGHLLIALDPQQSRRAWQVIGVAACELGELRLYGLSFGHLDSTGQEWLAQSCTALQPAPEANSGAAAPVGREAARAVERTDTVAAKWAGASAPAR